MSIILQQNWSTKMMGHRPETKRWTQNRNFLSIFIPSVSFLKPPNHVPLSLNNTQAIYYCQNLKWMQLLDLLSFPPLTANSSDFLFFFFYWRQGHIKSAVETANRHAYSSRSLQHSQPIKINFNMVICITLNTCYYSLMVLNAWEKWAYGWWFQIHHSSSTSHTHCCNLPTPNEGNTQHRGSTFLDWDWMCTLL